MFVSFFSLAIALSFIFSFIKVSDQSEDFDYHLRKVIEQGVEVEVEAVGVVVFPSSLSLAEISVHVKNGMASIPSNVNSIAASLREIEAKRSVAIAIAKNEATKSENRFIWGVGIGSWLALCLALYIFGWSIAWVRRGFRPGE